MPREPIPDDVRRFVLTSIPSVPFVEAMLLFKALRGQPVETSKVAERLYIPEKAAAALVQQLAGARIVEGVAGEPSSFRYAPPDELGSVLDRLAHAYVHDLIGVTTLIHSRTERMAQQFADAFKFRKDS